MMDVDDKTEMALWHIHRVLICDQIRNLKSKDHFVFKHAVFTPVPWDDKKISSASFLEKYPTDYKISFSKQGCESISSFCFENVVRKHCQFPSLDANFVCKSKLALRAEPVSFCQENCFRENSVPLDLYWDESRESCRLVDVAKKIFCLRPNSSNKVPPLYWNQTLNKCSISEEYCFYFGLTYKDGNCYNPAIEKFFEDFLFGKTIVRTLIHPSFVLGHIVDESKEQYICEQSNPGADAILAKEKLEGEPFLIGEGKQIAVWAAPETFAFIGNKSMRYLYNFSKHLDAHLHNSVLLLGANNLAREYLFSNVIKYLTKFTKYASNWYVFFLFLIGDALDAFDYLDLSHEMDTLKFENIIKAFEENFKKNIHDDLVTPEYVLQIESYKLKTKNKIQESFDLLYGGVENIIDKYRDYFGENYKGSNINFKEKIDKTVNLHTKRVFDRWPIRGTANLIGISTLISLSCFCLVSRNNSIIFLLVVLTIAFVMYLVKTSKWK